MTTNDMKKPSKKIVVIGGGTGVFTVLSGLKHSKHKLSAIVTMADDGGSTGILREEFGILPPGDVRRALVALSHDEKTLADLFAYRFEEGRGFEGHSLGNLLLTALERIHGSFDKAVDEAGTILGIKGQVIPVTFDRVKLLAYLEDGKMISGEARIDNLKKNRKRAGIKRVILKPAARANKKAVKAILEADLIVLGPGDLYTSIIPNLLVKGIAGAIRKSHASKALVINIMTKRGETDKFQAKDFVYAIEKYLNSNNILTHLVVNTAYPKKEIFNKYHNTEGADLIIYNPAVWNKSKFKILAGPLIRKDGKFIRHDPKKLAQTLLKILK
ncbi:MAG: hypothetical protein A3A97_02015 [Candidatus Terrybacteria bacterium RIFCSPLOWO2_01_FULL_40_23]|uniref:Putative gluconeogenesis factor n=1 Tax=Candidatus Terrybacteria bacterium RIFCSPLOWO2_01_FULL_40_23 TaxID=1802366 RepID=A0A1G2PQS9_9BACT|nr:MAG: hypothetical protein A3A97_02015 [Candidatus Terrybacteria bacterium RIFCSPLOWO2_01_FULL_40_23]